MKTKPTFKDWFFATHPWSFAVSALPAFVAMMYTMYNNTETNWQLGLLAIIGAVIFHAGGNTLSDYHDYKSGVDQLGKQGGTDLLTTGHFAAKQILVYSLSLIAIGIGLGLYLVSQSGIELLWIGIIGTIGAAFYLFFKYRALGDLIIFLVYGPTIMMGTGYAMTSQLDWTLFFVSLPMTFITMNVLHANNTRDQRSDRYADITTLAMKLGTKVSIAHYILLTALSYLGVAVMVALQILPITTLVTLLTIPIAYKNCKAMKEAVNDMSNINDLDLATAKLQTAFSVLMSLALIVSSVI